MHGPWPTGGTLGHYRLARAPCWRQTAPGQSGAVSRLPCVGRITGGEEGNGHRRAAQEWHNGTPARCPEGQAGYRP